MNVPKKCKATVARSRRIYGPCHRNAVRNGFCAQHHPDAKRARMKANLSAAAGFDDLTPNLSDAEKVWRCQSCGTAMDSSGPVSDKVTP